MTCARLSVVLLLLATPVTAALAGSPSPSDQYIREMDELSAAWSFYKHSYMEGGRVYSPDEGRITTSEGQGYAMLRAVWADDPEAFTTVWRWTREHLQVRHDHLFAWKWKGKVLDQNAASDADTDIALALVLASRRFNETKYLEQALPVIRDIFRNEVVAVKGSYYLTGGNWAPGEEYPTVHVAYLAPYAYEIFAQVDSANPWKRVLSTSYAVLNWLFVDQRLRLPPMKIYLNKVTGTLSLVRNGSPEPQFGYDVFPIYWRLALDARWHGRKEDSLRTAVLSFWREEWRKRERFVDKYSLDGQSRSSLEAYTLYASVHALASEQGEPWADELQALKIKPLWIGALQDPKTPYYLQNWLWFDRAFQLEATLHFDEFLGFLRPFHFDSFWRAFPGWFLGLALILFLFAGRFYYARLGFVVLSLALCARYLVWRLLNTLNFVESAGPLLSCALWLAEAYCFSTVALLIVQVGLRKKPSAKRAPAAPAEYIPAVDIFIPIYSEPLSILENTLLAALNIDYPNKKVYVCDDSHQDAVRELTESLGAHYIRGPKKHAKAGNMNNALMVTEGELVVIFDTDHIPVSSFLRETVPFFWDAKMGFVQTPHHFYNEDIFQRAFWTKDRIANEQDMFNHAIQSGRDAWGGSFFVGSGAVFRRRAIMELGGFKTMSITEDIHTSQHLHAKGWESAFVDKDLAVGLTAENLSSYIVQRRRWMLGCLQIFFKDNPLFHRGLSLRQRVGYFSSLWYFFFPAVRLVFLLAPLAFLLLHWHPVFSEISLLLAHLIPFMILLPMISVVLMPGWPRMFWGTVYENIVALPLARSMFDLFLPKNLGFKVTPKGIVSQTRSFDWASSRLTLIFAGLTLFAIIKGLWEFYFFQIEKDAYFFNLAWAGYNFLCLAMALAVAWENPQRRKDDRVSAGLPFEFRHGEFLYKGITADIGLGGIGFTTPKRVDLPAYGDLLLKDGSDFSFKVRVAYNKRSALVSHRVGLQFLEVRKDMRRRLVLHIFSVPERWEKAHGKHVRSSFGMGLEFYKAALRIVFSVLFSAMQLTRRSKPPTDDQENVGNDSKAV